MKTTQDRLPGVLVGAGLLLLVAACAEEGPPKLGVVLPLTGDAATYGVPVGNGVELAFGRLGAGEGTGLAVEYALRDSGSDPQGAAEKLRELYAWGALGAIGGVTTDEAVEMVDVADEYDRVLLSPSAASPRLSGLSKNFFRIFPPNFLEATTMANFATQTLGVKTVVVLAAESLFGRGMEEVFGRELERAGGEVLELIAYPAGTAEFSGLAERVMTINPQAVYIADSGPATGAMVEQLRARRFRGHLLTTSAFATPEVLVATGRAADGIYLTRAAFDVDSDEPQVVEFVRSYRERYGEDPGIYAAHGYDAVMALARALERAGRPTRQELWKGLRGLRDFTGLTGNVQFDERGDAQKYPRVHLIEDGAVKDYSKVQAAKRAAIEKRLEELDRRRREALRRQRQQGGSGGEP